LKDVRRTINHFWVGALIVFAAHNAEETIAFANGWAIHHLPRLSWTADQWPLFATVAAALTLGVGLVGWSLRRKPERSALWLRIFLWVMLLNAAWHVGVAAYTRSLAPGVVTAVLLVLPFYAFILRRLSRAGGSA
jgi:Protein of unknown function with HXXEE motif